ncbi:DUF935 family protein [Capnocytophaga sp. ARDL2]|uniref:phage portal protein family protein n=1 Tax=Capnocytophaga sp. ARDL2 TaxID=3238809 RepID=UPI003555EE27
MLKNIYKKAESFFLQRANPQLLKVVAEMKNFRSGALSASLTHSVQNISAKSLEDWKMAVLMATNPENPNRLFLYQLYENLKLDNHLISVIESRILHSQRSNFKIVNDKGDENQNLSWLFQRSWFEDFISLALWSKFEGTKLLELFTTNEAGELAEITEIPMPNFNTAKGIITKENGEENGWDYRKGKYANYYIQVGKDKDLGILSPMAPTILAKKLAMGSWLDFVEKYGIPPLFITTEREDERRMGELWDMAVDFKAANFMIGRGNEKFEIPNITSTNAQEVFDRLIERANSEISKRILGGTGLTDEKGFVGSVEIQYQLAKDRFESDKLFLQNLINGELIPRLIKLSPVYVPLQNHYFEWDNAEVFDSAKLADLVVKFGQHFHIDPEYIEQKTGIPILGIKSPLTPEGGITPNNSKQNEI